MYHMSIALRAIVQIVHLPISTQLFTFSTPTHTQVVVTENHLAIGLSTA